MSTGSNNIRAFKIAYKIWAVLLLSTLLNGEVMSNSNEKAVAELREYSAKLGIFASDLYAELSATSGDKNAIFSPFSIQVCVAMARLGATGQTAAEMDRGLHLYEGDTEKSSKLFHSILAHYANSNVLHIANKIFVQEGYEIQDEYNKALKDMFLSSADNVDFKQSARAATTINEYVESKTNNLIKDLISPQALDSFTRLVLINAIHFKGEWKHKFLQKNTRDEDFYFNENESVKVPMMSNTESYRWADLPELDATALEMPYRDTDLSMLIVLPNTRTGLKSLEQKLKTIPLSEISNKLKPHRVHVKIPKFKAEFSVELSEVFKKLGVERMFGDNAEFGKMLKSSEPLKVSKILHKAFIDVNEEGTEAAAATGAITRTKRAVSSFDRKDFIADHPFLYVCSHVRAKQTESPIPFFMGALRLSRGAATVAAPSSLPSTQSDGHDEL